MIMFTITCYETDGEKIHSHDMTFEEIQKQVVKLEKHKVEFQIFEVIENGKDHIEVSTSKFK